MGYSVEALDCIGVCAASQSDLSRQSESQKVILKWSSTQETFSTQQAKAKRLDDSLEAAFLPLPGHHDMTICTRCDVSL